MTEIRTRSKTGGEKGKKPAQLGAIDPKSLMRLAEVAGFGAEKYARFNMLKGYDWSLSYDALQRHLHAFWAGENEDDESGLPHLAHAAWHCLTLISFLERGLGEDDRYVQPDVTQPTLGDLSDLLPRETGTYTVAHTSNGPTAVQVEPILQVTPGPHLAQRILHCKDVAFHDAHMWDDAESRIFTCPGRSDRQVSL